MTDYSLYRLDPHSSRLIGAEVVHAADDVTAIVDMQQRAYGSSVELWDGGRKVARIDALPDGTALPPGSEG